LFYQIIVLFSFVLFSVVGWRAWWFYIVLSSFFYYCT